MIDQTRVTSGFDVEVLLQGGYLQNVLLLACDSGLIPVELTFSDPPVIARLMEPPLVDRTYVPHPEAPPLVVTNRADAFAVEVLFGHPEGADLKVTLRIALSKPSTGEELEGIDLVLFVRLGLETVHGSDGGLDSAALSVALVDIGGALVDLAAAQTPPTPEEELFAAVKEQVDRSFDLASVGSGSRLEDVALRKHPASDAGPAALGLYLNLRLRSGPEPDRFLAPRGDIGAAQNFSIDDADVVFATRSDIYDDMARDGKFRRAEPFEVDPVLLELFPGLADGFWYPVRRKPSDPTSQVRAIIKGVSMGPTALPPNGLEIEVHGEKPVDWFPDPDFWLTTKLFTTTDGDGVMDWDAESTFDTSFLADLLIGAVTGIVAIFSGPAAVVVLVSLEIAKEIAEEVVAELVVEPLAQKRVDAMLLDVAPNRLTMFRRRWDPLYETQHQIGLRPGGVLVNDHGLALWGKAVLTRARSPKGGVVIREAAHDDEGRATALRYRVPDLDAVRELLTAAVVGTDRGTFEVLDRPDEPLLVEVAVDDAIQRIAEGLLRGAHPYVVQRVETVGGVVTNLLVISQQEFDGTRSALVGAHADSVRPTIIADHEARIRDEVVAELEASGVIPTQEQVDAEVSKRLEALIAEAVAAYEEGQLGSDLAAAIEPLLRFSLSPDGFGDLQEHRVLTINDFDRITTTDPDGERRFYYRDHYVRAEEPTLALRLADNLVNRPKFRTAADGTIELL